MAERASNGLHDAKHTARITAAQDASDTVRETVAHMADKAAVLGQQASHRIYEALPDKEDRDTYLLGAAALAVAAAVGIAYQRRSPHEESARR
jgi:hypothetical protein